MLAFDDRDIFPKDPWARIEPFVKANPEMAANAILERMAARYAITRRFELVKSWLAVSLSTGSYLLYGAGSFTSMLLAFLREVRPDIVISGVLDRRAGLLGDYHGITVLPPGAGVENLTSRILIAHPVHEPAMKAHLLAIGVDSTRIQLLFDDPACKAYVQVEPFPPLERECPFCIIGNSIYANLPDDDLVSLFPVKQTMLLFFNPYMPYHPSPIYTSLDCEGSLDRLGIFLRQAKPRAILVRANSQNGFLALFAKKNCPDATLIHDMYDFSTLLSPTLLQGWLALSEEALTDALVCDYLSFISSDFVVSKRAGPLMDGLLKSAKARYLAYFPAPQVVTSVILNAPSPAQPWRVLYTGNLVEAKYSGNHSDYNFLPLCERLAASGNFSFDFYNAAHNGNQQDHLFQSYLKRYVSPPLQYHRRVEIADLAVSSGWHLGWLFRLKSTDESIFDFDAAVCIPGRAITYMALGLPILLDDSWGYLAELIRRFEAGLVVNEEVIAGLTWDSISVEHYARMRLGVERLHAFLQMNNASALQNLKTYIADKSKNK